MYKTFIAGITALSLTLSSATPAQANGFSEEDIGKFLLGLFATAAITSAIKNNQDEPEAPPAWIAPRPSKPQAVHVPRHPNGIRDNKVLPRACLRNFDTRFGNIRMFQRNCMRDNYRFVNNLPRSCTVRIATYNGPRNGWDPLCLRQAGYTTRRR